MGYRSRWYKEQREMMETIRISKKPVGRKRRAPNGPETWLALRGIGVKLERTLEDLLQVMHQPAPGERTPEIAVTLTADLAEELPPTIEPPARRKPLNPMGRYRIAIGGMVEANTVIARLEINAKVVIWSGHGEAQSDEMTRSTWILPLDSADKREKRYENQQDEK